MSKLSACQKAIKDWEEANGKVAAEATEIKLNYRIPSIDKMDPQALNTLTNCVKLSLSSNAIDKMIPLANLRNLEVLSLSRNQIKKIAGLEEIGQTLKELWLSYNLIEKLDGIQPCQKLQVLYIGCNKLKAVDEVDKLKELPLIRSVVFQGNPFYALYGDKDEAKAHIYKRIGTLELIDGLTVTSKILEKIKE